MFVSTHYAGEVVGMRFQDSEPWKKVFGPVLVYLNSVSGDENPLTLWEDAKQQVNIIFSSFIQRDLIKQYEQLYSKTIASFQMSIEVESWPYDFPLSEDFHSSNQRGTVRGRLVVHDRY